MVLPEELKKQRDTCGKSSELLTRIYCETFYFLREQRGEEPPLLCEREVGAYTSTVRLFKRSSDSSISIVDLFVFRKGENGQRKRESSLTIRVSMREALPDLPSAWLTSR